MKLVHGVGINDADYVVEKREELPNVGGKRQQRLVWVCCFYMTWKNMLERCYSKLCLERKPTYKGCSVCEDWMYFSKFKSWMDSQDYEGKQLDKDLLFKGNKIYSPTTCVFVLAKVNSFLLDNGAKRGKWPLGVSFRKQLGKFEARCRNPFSGKSEYLGLFIDPNEAHLAWKKRKHELACIFAEQETDERIKSALTTRYTC